MVKDQIDQIRSMRKAGKTYQAIAEKLGLSKQTIYARLNYYGTKPYNDKKRAERRRRLERSKHES